MLYCAINAKHANKIHQFRIVDGSFLPYLCPLLPDCHNILIPICGHWWPQVFTAEAMINSSFQVMSLLIWLGGYWA